MSPDHPDQRPPKTPDFSIDRDDLDEVVAMASRSQTERQGTDDTVHGEELALIAEAIGIDHRELFLAQRAVEAQRREKGKRKKLALKGAFAAVTVLVLVSAPFWWQKVFPPNYEALALESAQLTEKATQWRARKQPGFAREAAFKAVKKDPKNFEAWNMAALCYEDMEDFAEARQAYLKGIAVAKTQPEAAALYSNYGLLLSKSPASRDEALKYYRLALQCDPRHAPALNNLAFLYEQRGNLPEAKQHYEEALKALPDYKPALDNLAKLNKRIGLADKPIPKEAAAIEAGALVSRMWTLHDKQNKPKEAIQLGLQGVSRFPDSFLLWNELGLAYKKDSQALEAVKAFTMAVQLGGDQRDACYPNYNMGRLMASAGKHQEAAEYYKKSTVLWPGNKDYHMLLGKEYEILGRTQEASAEFKAVLKIDPQHADAREGLNRL